MAKYLIDSETLIGIANAIREKSGKTDSMLASEMIDEIMNLSNGGGEELDVVIAEQAELIEELSATLGEKIGAYEVGYDAAIEKLTDLEVTENGEYVPEGESTGFKSVSVNVASTGGGDLDALIERSITEVNSGVTSIGSNTFDGCKQLKNANFPNTTNIGYQSFNSCEQLTSVSAPNALIVGGYAFQRCYVLTGVNVPNVTSIDQYAFNYCYALTSLDFPKVTSIGGSRAFGECRALKSVILRSETMCTLSNTNAFTNCYHILGTVHSTYNPNGDKDGYIYVPRALLSDDDETKDYRRATNWSTYSTQFRALEDYTIDGTITGELDPNKI